MMRRLSNLKNLSQTSRSCSTCVISAKLSANFENPAPQKISTPAVKSLFSDTTNVTILPQTISSAVFAGLFVNNASKENNAPDLKAVKNQQTDENNPQVIRKRSNRLKGNGDNISGLSLQERFDSARPIEELDNKSYRSNSASLRS